MDQYVERIRKHRIETEKSKMEAHKHSVEYAPGVIAKVLNVHSGTSSKVLKVQLLHNSIRDGLQSLLLAHV
jgi:hypothetical protein